MQENGDVGDDAINRGVQYPFSVNEKVIIKVSSFHSLSILSVGPYFRLDQIGVIKGMLYYAGEPKDSRKICWQGSSHHIPVSKWLVSWHDHRTCAFVALFAFHVQLRFI